MGSVAVHPAGPAAETLRANLRRIRTGKHLSYADLCERLRRAGRALPPLTLARMETGRRRIDADDLVALAVALDVTPVDLLVPGPLDDHTPWRATAAVAMPASQARAWIGGRPVTPPRTQAVLAEAIRWMPRSRAMLYARQWTAQQQI